MRRRVVVTGLGAVSPLGITAKVSWNNLIAGKSGLSSIDLGPKVPCKVAGKVPPSFDFAKSHSAYSSSQKYLAPFMQFGIAAAEEALTDAAWNKDLTPLQRQNTGVCIGSGIGALDEITRAANQTTKLSPFFIPKILMNLLPSHLAIHHGFLGPNHACSTACATGGNSIGDAMRYTPFIPSLYLGLSNMGMLTLW
jgi:3-oxoacyl-[acyl-carrier-protein] synthase II